MGDMDVVTENAANQLKSSLDDLLTQLKAREDKLKREISDFKELQERTIEETEKQSRKKIKDAESKAANTTKDAESKAAKTTKDAEFKAIKILEVAQEEVDEMKKEIEQWNEEKKRLEHIQTFSSQIKIDVGGMRYTTSLTTLRRFPDTMIGAMFSGRHSLPLDDEKYFFIDRDGTHFRHILNFLRDPENFVVELSEAHLQEMIREANYYGLLELMFPLQTDGEIIHNFEAINVSRVDKLVVFQNEKGLWHIQYNFSGGHRSGVATWCRECDCAFLAPTNDQYRSYGSNFVAVKQFMNARRRIRANDSQPSAKRNCPVCTRLC